MEKKRINPIFITLITIASVCTILALVLAVMVIAKHGFSIDEKAMSIVNKIRNGNFTKFQKIFTHLGSFVLLIFFVIIATIFVPTWRTKTIGILSFLSGAVISTIIKYIIQRPRPSDVALIEEVGYSFPSAHALLSTIFFGFLIYVLLLNLKNKPAKIIVSILIGIIPICVGFSRVYLGVHFLSDVLAGLLLGVATLIFSIYLYGFLFDIISKKVKDKKQSANNWFFYI